LFMSILIIVLLLMAAFVFFILVTKAKHAQPGQLPYQKAKALFTPAERSLLGVMDQALGAEFRVFGKVRIADVVCVASTANKAQWQKAFNKISSKHFDYVVCKASDLSIICVVELNDKSHQQQSRKARDAFVASVCQSAALPLVAFTAQGAYTIADIKQKFEPLLNGAGTDIEPQVNP
jgi:hypothetical protein